MRRFHMPVWLDGASRPRAGTFVALFSLEAWGRATLITVVPLQAHAVLGDAQAVSLLYFAVSIIGLTATLVVPMIVHRVRRRWAFTLGGVLLMCAVAGYAVGTAPALIVGLACQVTATAFLEIVLNLYIFDHVPRAEIKGFEPRRLLFAAVPFTIGPWLGVWLYENAGPWVTYVLVGSFAVAMLGYFWFLRIVENPAVTGPLRRPPSPIRYLPRFASQPRLRLAWVLAVGRTAWWIMFYVYAPIYVTEAGYSPETGGAVVSLATLPLFLMPLWAAIGRKKGLRFLLMLGYGLAGVTSLLVGAFSATPWLGVVLLLMAAASALLVDGAGNVPFLRAVHPHERSEMTSVYVTFRQTGQLIAPCLFAIALSVFALPAVFVVGGVTALSMAALASKLPKKL